MTVFYITLKLYMVCESLICVLYSTIRTPRLWEYPCYLTYEQIQYTIQVISSVICEGNHKTFVQTKAVENGLLKYSFLMSYIFHGPNNTNPWHVAYPTKFSPNIICQWRNQQTKYQRFCPEVHTYYLWLRFEKNCIRKSGNGIVSTDE